MSNTWVILMTRAVSEMARYSIFANPRLVIHIVRYVA